MKCPYIKIRKQTRWGGGMSDPPNTVEELGECYKNKCMAYENGFCLRLGNKHQKLETDDNSNN